MKVVNSLNKDSVFHKILTTIFCGYLSENDILGHGDQYEQFYSSFVALASHHLSSCAGTGKLDK